MGVTASSLSGTGATTTASSLSDTDRLEADKLISMKATNALKNVNNSFYSPSNGHIKRKSILPSPRDVSPVRHSR